MGFLFSKIFNKLAGEKEVRILILGLDNAGKTTLLYKMQLNNVVQTVPTIGVNVENVEYRNLKFQAWDVGGQASIRPYWRSYYPKTNAIIYMIDSSDRARMKTSKDELMLMLEEQELKGVPLVLLANKQDFSNAMTEDEISEGLGLSTIKEHQWAIFRCSAITGFGVDEAMEWMTNIINSENKS